MHRLYLQVYLTLVGVLILSMFIGFAGYHWMGAGLPDRKIVAGIAEILAERLPPAGADPVATRRELDSLRERLSADVTLYDRARRRIARSGREVAFPIDAGDDAGSIHGRTLVLRLPDQRWLLMNYSRRRGPFGPTWALAALAIGVGLGAWPLARRLTRRLERLRTRVEALGSGDLRSRVEVEGRDEIADLARSFNRAAQRIESLVESQRRMVATASHELRTPLARLRVAIELLEGDARPDLRERIARDIDELDELVGEILLSTRLESSSDLDTWKPVDLCDLASEEARAAGVPFVLPSASGEPPTSDKTLAADATAGLAPESESEPAMVRGDPRLLRRALRNMIENAQRHSASAPAEVEVFAADSRVIVRVSDRGPGVPAEERDRIFEAFYRPPGSRETGQGWGLGLSLVRSIAQRHGGEVYCADRPGGGTRFEFAIPALDG